MLVAGDLGNRTHSGHLSGDESAAMFRGVEATATYIKHNPPLSLQVVENVVHDW